MQILTYIKSRFIRIIAVAFTILIVFVYISPRTSAQYGRDTYGSCEYGVSCPVTDAPGGDTNNTQQPPIDDSSEDPTDNQDDDQTDPDDDADTGDVSDSDSGAEGRGLNRELNGIGGGLIYTAPEQPNSNTRSQTEETGVFTLLRSPITFVRELPPEQQAFLPYYTWLLLLILAIILILQAYYDRYKTQKLKQEVAQLERTIEEQKAFLHLVMHYLNTPVSLIRNAIELVASDPQDKEVVVSLQEPVGQLSSAVNDITTTKIDTSDYSAINQATIQQAKNYSAWKDRMYYIVPIAVASFFGLGITYLLYKAEAIQPVHHVQYQIGIIVMSSFIFMNAVRIFRINRIQMKVLNKSKEIAQHINAERNAVIMELSQKLENISDNLSLGIMGIRNAQYKNIVQKGVDDITRLYVRARASVESLSASETNFELHKFLTEMISRHQQQIQEKQLNITTHYSSPDLIITYHDDLVLAIESVFGNSITYNKEHGSIDIQTWTKGNKLYISIDDTGIGMSESELSQAFKPFYQEADVLQFDHGGVSLSLFASQKAMQRLGGGITLHSEHNRGTQATISLPVGL